MDKQRVLLLYGNGIEIFTHQKENIEYVNTYNDSYCAKIFRNIKPLIGGAITNDLKLKIKSYNVIVIFDAFYKKGIIEYIKKRNKDARIILYFWNRVNATNISKNVFDNKDVEIWSYNKEDCLNYGIKYNHQFWNPEIVDHKDNDDSYDECKYDICFIGNRKGRDSWIGKIEEYSEKNGLKIFMHIVDQGRGKRISYSNHVNKIACNSRAILDLVTSENYGLTLRPLESLFLNKKLITTLNR